MPRAARSRYRLRARGSFRLLPWHPPTWPLALSASALFFFNDTATTEIYTLSLHDALPISSPERRLPTSPSPPAIPARLGLVQWPRGRAARSASASLLHTLALQPLRRPSSPLPRAARSWCRLPARGSFPLLPWHPPT